MARPQYPVEKAKRILMQWILGRAVDEQITVQAALDHLKVKGIPAHRATLYEHGLHKLVAEGAKQQRVAGKPARAGPERRAYDAQIDALQAQNEMLEARNRALLGEIAVMVWNARRLGIREEELRHPLPKPDRSRSRAGR